MRIDKYTCDKCGKTIESDRFPESWNELRIEYYVPTEYEGNKTKRYHFCTECSELLGIKQTQYRNNTKSTADRLVEILTEIAHSAIQQP